MATEIKIYIADGRDQDAKIDLTPEQAAHVRDFLNKIRYGNVYPTVPSWGDGNTAGCPSDRETTTTLHGLKLVGAAFTNALKP